MQQVAGKRAIGGDVPWWWTPEQESPGWSQTTKQMYRVCVSEFEYRLALTLHGLADRIRSIALSLNRFASWVDRYTISVRFNKELISKL